MCLGLQSMLLQRDTGECIAYYDHVWLHCSLCIDRAGGIYSNPLWRYASIEPSSMSLGH